MLQRRKNLLNGLGFLLLLGMLGTSLSSFLVSRTSIRSQISDSTLPLIGDTIYSEVQRDLLRPIFVASLMSNNTFVHDWVAAGEQDLAGMNRYLDTIKENYGAITAFFVSESTRGYYYSGGILKTVNQAEQRDAWYFRLRESNEAYEVNTDPDLANGDNLTVFVNYRVLNSDGKFLGAIGVGLAIDSLVQLIEQYSDTFNRQIYFANANGDIQLNQTVHGGQTKVAQIPGLQNHASNILNPSQNASLKYTQHGSTAFLNSRFIEELDWFLIVEERETLALHSITKTLVINLFTSLAIALLVLTLAHRILNRYNRELEFSAHHDNLTGAYNRQYFEAVARDTFKLADRKEDTVSVMFIDIDLFKNINDQFGHAAGDEVIRQVASIINHSVRHTDLVCRWGGEEYSVLLPNTTQSDAFQLAQKVRKLVKDTPIEFEKVTINVTVSIGVTQRINTELFEACLERSDDALYAAKNNGRDQVCTSTPKPAFSMLTGTG